MEDVAHYVRGQPGKALPTSPRSSGQVGFLTWGRRCWAVWGRRVAAITESPLCASHCRQHCAHLSVLNQFSGIAWYRSRLLRGARAQRSGMTYPGLLGQCVWVQWGRGWRDPGLFPVPHGWVGRSLPGGSSESAPSIGSWSVPQPPPPLNPPPAGEGAPETVFPRVCNFCD